MRRESKEKHEAWFFMCDFVCDCCNKLLCADKEIILDESRCPYCDSKLESLPE